MQCRDSQASLSAFADRELSAFAALRLRRHLRRCTECAGMLSELEAVDRATAGLHEGASLSASLRAQFVAAAERESAFPVAASLTGSTRVPSSLFARRPIALTAGLAGLAGVGVVAFVLLASSPPRVAFADVARAMGGIRTIHFVGTLSNRFPLDKTPSHSDVEVWGRAASDRPALVIRQTDYNFGRSTTSRDTWDRKGLTIRGFENRVEHVREPREATASLRHMLDVRLLMPLDLAADRAMHSLPSPMTWKPGRTVVLDGQPALRFDGHAGIFRETLYADPRTYLLLRCEIHSSSPDAGDQDIIYRDFSYNEPLSAEAMADAN